MRSFSPKSFFLALLAASPLFLMSPLSARAQDGSMKACGEKWQAAKAANATNGATWTKFLAECRAAGSVASATPAAASLPAAKPAVEKPVVEKSLVEKPVVAAKAGAAPVFPAAVSPKFAELRPGQARQKTCSEQYQANKTSDGNGGLRWLEKGGGYWSLCNKKLKGV